jgi:head-tail adaptor
MSSRGRYNRYVQFQTPTDTNTKGSVSKTWANTFTSYANKEMETSSTSDAMEKRTTESKGTWKFPYNSAIVRDGRFYELNAATKYYYVVGVSENEYQTEMTVNAELRV